jgi:glucose-1-phosphate adenylyltransferase
MGKQKILAIVMAGGEGTRLFPLTAERSKPSVPFGARYRIVDFALSNLVNSGINAIYLLVQYKSQSLIEHVRKTWVLPPMLPGQFVTVVPPQMRRGRDWFLGTSDAVYQNINLILLHRPDLVLVFSADHVYRMDVRQMIQFHLERQADATVAALPVPLAQASAFGIIQADEHCRIKRFLEKPEHPPPMVSDPEHAYASMGNYVFTSGALLDALHNTHQRDEIDFGRHVLPSLADGGRLYAYDFSRNRVPGIKDYEETGYWRDVGTLDAYYEANMDVLGLKPRFDVFNAQWPIYSSNYQGPAARFIDTWLGDAMVSAGCILHGARVKNSVLRRDVVLEPGVEVEDSIIMDHVVVRRGAKIRRAIIDRYNLIGMDERIGYDAEADSRRYHLTESGLTVLPEGHSYEMERSSLGKGK